MIKVIKKEIDMGESLKKRLEIICYFCNIPSTITNGSIGILIRQIYCIAPHRIIINNIILLIIF